jgi:hypothetical protein
VAHLCKDVGDADVMELAKLPSRQMLPIESGWPLSRRCQWLPDGPNSFQSSMTDGMGLAACQMLPMAFCWPRIIPKQHYQWHGIGPKPDDADDLLMAHSCSEAVLPIALSWPISAKT